MSQEIFEMLVNFVIDESAVDDEEINRSTRIYNDLGIYGDDATDFLIAYGKEFNVDVSKFMAGEYFRPEGDVILPAIIRCLTGKNKPRLKTLTVGDLEKGILARRLDNEIINS